MFAGFKDAIGQSLQLEEPWYIESVKFDNEEKQVHIYVGIRKDAVIACPHCGAATQRNGYENQERVWRHSDCFFYPTYVHCRRPRVRCPNCGVMQVNAPFERKNCRFTFAYEGYAMLLLTDMPIAKAAEMMRCNEKSLVSIMRHWINNAVERESLETVEKLAIDETSFRKGYKYVSLFIDAAGRKVIDVEPGKDKMAVAAFAEKLEKKGGSRENVVAVTSDMSASFVPAIAENFVNAINIIDKFHVKKTLLDALDKVRKSEQRESEDKKALFRSRFMLMKPAQKLCEAQKATITTLSKQYPKTGRAYRIVAALDDLYSCWNKTEAEIAFKGLCSWMSRSRLPSMKAAAGTLRRHKEKILAYFDERMTNAVCEGINSMVQAAKRKARGFQTFEGFEAMIYLVAGKLELMVPSPFVGRPRELE